VSLAHDDVVPHIIIQSSRLRSGEFETHTAKGLLQHYLPQPDILDLAHWVEEERADLTQPAIDATSPPAPNISAPQVGCTDGCCVFVGKLATMGPHAARVIRVVLAARRPIPLYPQQADLLRRRRHISKGHLRTHAPQQRCVLFDQFVGRKQRWGAKRLACSGIGVVVQRFAIGPGVMVTRSTSATVG
jgi:hypothetical protein